jgi:eukaryotic-like serine/threonine-protein kinase
VFFTGVRTRAQALFAPEPVIMSPSFRMTPPDGQKRVLRFGVFEIDTQEGELRRSGMRQKLAPQPFQVLQMLLERPGELVTRDELQKRLWPTGTVTDYDLALKKCVNRIRQILADSAQSPRFIETVPRRGYRFIAAVERVGGNGSPSVADATKNGSPAVPPAPEMGSILSPAPTPARKLSPERPPGLDQIPGAMPIKRPPIPARHRRLYGAVVAILSAAAILVMLFYSKRNMRTPSASEWVQLTNFPDSATSPALSPDGRMLAFIHGPSTFATPGQIFVKVLPAGQPVQLTHDANLKDSPAFSSDGSRISYAVSPSWDTWIVPVLGGEPRLTLPNASGLTWLDERHILFSELKRGMHMGIVTASESRVDERDVYLPRNDTGMAHKSYISPDHKWMLVVEMDAPMGWLPCRLLPFDGSSPGKPVGPPGSPCTNAGWSRDGKWMFLNSAAGGSFHIWRQRFPYGEAEQITFGPTAQEGIVVSPDGRSVLTSEGLESSTLWVHDRAGEHQIAFEGLASFPGAQMANRALFSPDGTKLFFMAKSAPAQPAELWLADLNSGRADRLFPRLPVIGTFDVSPDGKQVVLNSPDANGELHIWMASLDHRVAPHQIGSSGQFDAVFGPAGDLFFEASEGKALFLYRRAVGEAENHKVIANPISNFETISPDGNWAVAEMPVPGEDVTRGVIAYPLRSGTPKRVCHNLCIVRWTMDGRFLNIGLPEQSGSTRRYKTIIVPLRSGEDFPPLPPGGIKSANDLAGVPGVKAMDELIRPGPTGSIYAMDRMTVQRNIYLIPLP